MTYSVFLAFLTLAVVSGEPLSHMHHHSDLISRVNLKNTVIFQVKLYFPTPFLHQVKALLTQTAVTGPPPCYLFSPIDFYLISAKVSLNCPELKLDFLQKPTCRPQGLWHIEAKQGCQNNNFTHISRGAAVILPLICHDLAGDVLYVSLPDRFYISFQSSLLGDYPGSELNIHG